MATQTTYLIIAVTTVLTKDDGPHLALRHSELVDERIAQIKAACGDTPRSRVRVTGESSQLRHAVNHITVISCDCDDRAGTHVHVPESAFPRYAGNAGLGVSQYPG